MQQQRGMDLLHGAILHKQTISPLRHMLMRSQSTIFLALAVVCMCVPTRDGATEILHELGNPPRRLHEVLSLGARVQ